jgi:PAS domain-containing protein
VSVTGWILLAGVVGLVVGVALGVLVVGRSVYTPPGTLERALDAAPVSVCVADEAGIVIACGGGAVKRAGYKPSDVVGAPLDVVLAPDGQVIAAWEAVRQGASEQLVLHRGEAKGSAKLKFYLSWFGRLGPGVAMVNIEATDALSAASQRQLAAIQRVMNEGGRDVAG